MALMGTNKNKSSRSNYKLEPHGSLSAEPHSSLSAKFNPKSLTDLAANKIEHLIKMPQLAKPKSLVQLAAEKTEQSIKQLAKIPKASKLIPTLKTLAAKGVVKNNINYWENKTNNDAPIIRLDKKTFSIVNIREDELAKSRVSRYSPNTTFQNLFEERLNRISGKRDRVQVMIEADVENWNGQTRMVTPKTFGPFSMEMSQLSNDDVYKFMVFTLLQHDFSILSTQTIANIGAKIMIHKPLEFTHMKVGALKLNSFFLDKQFPIKQRGDNTCMMDFIWHQRQNKVGFKRYTYQKLKDELSEFTTRFPFMSTQEVVDWAKECHPNISIHAYDSTYKKFMKHIATTPCHDISLVFFIKGNHCYPNTDERLKVLATKANQGGVDNLWKFMTDMKWSRGHEQFVVINDMEEEEQLDVSNKVIVLTEDEKIEPVIDRYIYRTNYFVEYLHFNNNGRLDGFIDHKCNMYILNDQYETRKQICDSLFDKFKTADFVWSNQSYTNMATSLFKQMCGYLPESCYDTKTQQVLDDFYPKALQWSSTGNQPDNLVSLDISNY